MKTKETVKSERKPLTVRETEILRLIASGCTGRQIAGKLFISERTVDTHRTHIRNKTRCHNTAELTRYAMMNGILDEKQGK
ncbi:MAG TPA: LuxR C-terminal-related transcriptional regulator [Chitinophagales bacterium]|nr:LuxR C-terminal-related transcriptional regulator [Chitinophagales bacterium]